MKTKQDKQTIKQTNKQTKGRKLGQCIIVFISKPAISVVPQTSKSANKI